MNTLDLESIQGQVTGNIISSGNTDINTQQSAIYTIQISGMGMCMRVCMHVCIGLIPYSRGTYQANTCCQATWALHTRESPLCTYAVYMYVCGMHLYLFYKQSISSVDQHCLSVRSDRNSWSGIYCT